MKISITQSFRQLLLMNIKLIYRNSTGVFYSLAMPILIYVVLSLLPIDRFFNTKIDYSTFVLPGIIAMTIMQGGIYGLAYWMIDMRTRGVIKRFLVTPISKAELMFSVLISRILLALAQVVIISLIGFIFFAVPVSLNLLLVLPIAVIGAAIFLTVGLLIARVANSYESAAPIITVVTLPLTFFGNIFFPTSSLPGLLGKLGTILPISYFADAMRNLFLGNIDWTVLLKDTGVLLIWLIVMLLVALRWFRLEE